MMNVANITIELIDEDDGQPRNSYNEESMSDLVQSIREIGLQSPIKVRQTENGRYKIIFGHRRYRAHKILGIPTIAAILSVNESEQDIFFQQLAENIQRDDFTPIEEANAFKKALDNDKWSISIKYLAGKLGKQEKYISDKIHLLGFGSSVKNIIHSKKEIIPDKLSEQQVLPLKDLPIEYKDRVALKVASEQIPVNDVKKIASLFSSKDISEANKESFLEYSSFKLIEIFKDYDLELKKRREPESKKGIPAKPKIVDDNYIDANNSIEFKVLPIEEEVHNLLKRVPPAHPISEKDILSFKEMKLDGRKELNFAIDCLIGNLEGQLAQWKKIREMIQKDGIQRVK
ncbi:MAG: ParB/RepB/Spo0J family partition protein [Clostridia bacterium]|nr:ParB/RepB/Spo0J family partition protein [Clostridia bacterium]